MQPNPPVQPLYRWTEVWTLATTRPQADSFRAILQDPVITWTRGVAWLFLTGLVSAFVAYNVIVNDAVFQTMLSQMSLEAGLQSGVSNAALMTVACFIAPFAAGFNVLAFGGLAWVMHLLAQRTASVPFEGAFVRFFYCVSAITSPMGLIGAFVTIVPFLGFLGLVILIYQAYLYKLAVEAVYGLQGRASLMVVALPILGFVFLQVFFLGSLLI